MPLEISLLGPFQVMLDGATITAFEANSARALLAYLACHAGMACQRDVLAGLLWPDYPNADALRNLRKALYRVRKALSSHVHGARFLLAPRDTIQLSPESDYQVDVSAFDRAVAFATTHGHRRAEDCAACAQRLSEAVELYRGEFLAGFSLPSALFEEWVVLERERLHRLALEALVQLAAYHGIQGTYAEAAEHARRALALEPWSEPAHRQLMRALALSGDRSGALAQYEACCRVLQEELGVEPEEETTQLYEGIRDQSGTRSLPEIGSLGNLPAQGAPFVGRERELAALGRLLADPEVRLVTVVGAGGMGKTRLALQAAQAALACYPGGAWLVELAPLLAARGAADGVAVPRAVASALGVQEQPGRSLPEVIAGALQGRELLLVLDNCEHVLAGVAPLVALLLARCPDLVILATSREPLRVAGEHLYDVPGMEVPEPPDLTGPERPDTPFSQERGQLAEIGN